MKNAVCVILNLKQICLQRLVLNTLEECRVVFTPHTHMVLKHNIPLMADNSGIIYSIHTAVSSEQRGRVVVPGGAEETVRRVQVS